MALYRQLQLSFWRDGFVMELTPEEKFFYVYLLQCSNTKQCGIFELPKRAIEYETGYNRETVDKLLERFINYGKIEYCERTKEIMIVNWIKYNFINSRNTILCINKELKEVKNKEFVDKLYDQCEKLSYPLEEIFKDISELKNKIRGLQGAYKPLGEEEIKEEIEEVEEIEIKSEIEEKEEAEKIADEKIEIQEKLNQELNSAAATKGETSSISQVIEVFNNNIHPITPIELERLGDWSSDMSYDAIILAIKEAVQHNARTMKYINSVLNNWHSLGLTTGKAVLAYQRDWKDKNKNKASVNHFEGANAQAYVYVE